jgi:hypothetical protein
MRLSWWRRHCFLAAAVLHMSYASEPVLYGEFDGTQVVYPANGTHMGLLISAHGLDQDGADMMDFLLTGSGDGEGPKQYEVSQSTAIIKTANVMLAFPTGRSSDTGNCKSSPCIKNDKELIKRCSLLTILRPVPAASSQFGLRQQRAAPAWQRTPTGRATKGMTAWARTRVAW